MATQNLKRKSSWLKVGSYLGGIALLMVFFPIKADTGQQREEGSTAFQQAVQYPLWIQDPYSGDTVLTKVNVPNTDLWNAKRITDYEDTLLVNAAPPLGILTIEKLDIQVPIYNGTDEFNLNRGAGRIKGMARMDEDGNLGISGHRDGFFRGLKDIQVGDDIEVETTLDDISILAPTTDKIMTIVTCYPFYFVGHAPKRYIVKATAKPSLEHE